MCLLVVLSRVHPELPLVIAANRDELLARPATAMTVLRESGPKILGGRDDFGGGTWLAVNEHGVVAGLTNAPPGKNGRDPSKKSRGALPLKLAAHARADEAVALFRDEVVSGDYNPCWMLCGDRRSLSYIDLTVPATPVVETLPPGIHILENRPLHAASPKVDAVRAAMAGCERWSVEEVVPALERILRDHSIPDGIAATPRGDPPRPPETEACCVHAGPYGTRSAEIALVPRDERARPRLRFAPGPSCVTAWQDAPGW